MRKLLIPRHEGGQGLVEFVLILPILIFILFAIVDMGRVIYYKALISNVTRESTRMVSIGKDISLITGNIQSFITPITGSVTTTVTAGNDDTGVSCTKAAFTPSSGKPLYFYITPVYSNTLLKGQNIRVCITYQVDFITPLSSLISKSINIKEVYFTALESPPA